VSHDFEPCISERRLDDSRDDRFILDEKNAEAPLNLTSYRSQSLMAAQECQSGGRSSSANNCPKERHQMQPLTSQCPVRVIKSQDLMSPTRQKET
jgi:hypothetical protein